MTRREFNFGIVMLRNAFPAGSERITPETEDIYWHELQRIPRDIWETGIRHCIAHHSTEYSFFPGVHDIGVACFGERKEEHVWKCDPYRTIQNYREKIEPETWQQRMEKVLSPQIEGVSTNPALLTPEIVMRPNREEARAALASISAEIEEMDAKKKVKVAEQPSLDIERRKAVLRDQAKIAIGKYGG